MLSDHYQSASWDLIGSSFSLVLLGELIYFLDSLRFGIFVSS